METLAAIIPAPGELAACLARALVGGGSPRRVHGLRVHSRPGRPARNARATDDGLEVYLEAVEGAFGNDIDYAMLVKTYEGDSGKRASAERRYSPAVCTGAQKQKITGEPDAAHISTNYIERQNLTMRMSIRRFTRLTNAFSKKVDNHKAAQALYFMHYNFGRIHKTLR